MIRCPCCNEVIDIACLCDDCKAEYNLQMDLHDMDMRQVPDPQEGDFDDKA